MADTWLDTEIFSLAQGRDATPTGPVNWSCPFCGSTEVLVRWEAFGSQVGGFARDGRFRSTHAPDIYECEAWDAPTCADCDELVRYDPALGEREIGGGGPFGIEEGS